MSDTPGPIPSLDPRADRVAAAVASWQRELVDLGGRNTLLWYRDLASGTLDLTMAHPGGLSKLLAGNSTRLSELFREQAVLAEARRRAKTIRAKAVELHEERGIAAGFIAMGMATWSVPKASRPPQAPVFLRPCVLRPIGAAQADFVVDLTGDLEFNPVLAHYLRSEQGLDIDEDALIDTATLANRFNPHLTYAALTKSCASVPEFSIEGRYILGTFSYAKLPMVADLAAQGAGLADHDVVAALAGDPDALRSVRTTLPEALVDHDPGREYLVLDADSSQHAVIDAVRTGAHLVVKGPPGTGKSQTIANLIATLASDGRRVLFVAEKRAAIDAVVRRLDGVGLGSLILDAYDGAANKRGMARSFGERLAEFDAGMPGTDRSGMPSARGGGGTPAQRAERAVQAVRDRRAVLVEHVDAVHRVREPWGISVYDAYVALAELAGSQPAPASPVRLDDALIQRFSRARIVEVGRQLTEAAELGAWSQGDANPWFGARIDTADEAAHTLEIVGSLSRGRLGAVSDAVSAAATERGLPAPRNISEIKAIRDLLADTHATLRVFRAEIFDDAAALGSFVAATANGAWRREHQITGMGFFDRRRLRTEAAALLVPGHQPADLHTALGQARDVQLRWVQMAGPDVRPTAPPTLDEMTRSADTLAADVDWLGDRLAATPLGGELTGIPLDDLQGRVTDLASRPDRLAALPKVRATLAEIRAEGLGDLLDDLARRVVAPGDVNAEIDRVWWSSVLDHISLRDGVLSSHDGAQLDRVAQEFAAADRVHIAGSPARVAAMSAANARRILEDHPEQEALVRAEAGKSRRHRPLREMLPRAGAVMTALKPCWVMSPLVVASVVPPGEWFDVVIFDEASQIPPAQAISAISRARQVVVAGDEQQLPPTTFFMTAVDDGDEYEVALDAGGEVLTDGFESVLDVLTAALPVRRLTWHYRSRDERLIAFANDAMYAGSLVTFPSTATEPAVTLEPVDGTAAPEPGATSLLDSTPAEVARVVELVLEHARTRPHDSLGVIALGLKHATRLDEAIQSGLADAPDRTDLAPFFDDERPERFFVKNLERVQGDERDAIILAIGFGKTRQGRVLHRFGPLNNEGGERRLNVATTRARIRMTVVSSLRADDLDPARLTSPGARMLRDFLAYAEREGMPAAVAGDVVGEGVSTDALIADFARRLRDHGLTVHEEYGHAHHRLDLAVESPREPGRVLVAVEGDGPAYAAVPSARDRDRLRVEQLRRLGWAHVRVWSADLARDPGGQISRVADAVRAATGNAPIARVARGPGDPAP